MPPEKIKVPKDSFGRRCLPRAWGPPARADRGTLPRERGIRRTLRIGPRLRMAPAVASRSISLAVLKDPPLRDLRTYPSMMSPADHS
jgi:hypothetical protein